MRHVRQTLRNLRGGNIEDRFGAKRRVPFDPRPFRDIPDHSNNREDRIPRVIQPEMAPDRRTVAKELLRKSPR